MAADPTLAPRGELQAKTDAFENELPTYRALSALALTSAAAGLLSALSFIAPWWLVLAAIAIACGFLADRRIRRMPDVLTGRSFAQAGLALGLIFGVSSLAYSQWSAYALRSGAMRYARGFVASLNEANGTRPIQTHAVLWYMLPPSMTRDTTPEEAGAKIDQMLKGSSTAQQIEETLKQMLRHAGQGNPITVAEAEQVLLSDGDAYAPVLINVGDGRPRPEAAKNEAAPGPPDHDHSAPGHDHDHDGKGEAPRERISEIIGEGADHALVYLLGAESNGQFRWYVKEIKYPYVPKSFTPVATKKAADDGHGHDH